MSARKAPVAPEDRLDWLSTRLERAGTVTISDAAASLAVSEMTVRRDLDRLAARGTARRTRGGARAVGPQRFAQRDDVAGPAKARLAAKVRDLIPAAGTIAIDASSTAMRVATQITGARDLHVLTNGPDTFAVLQDRPGVHALLTGGHLDARTGSYVGPLACRAAESLAVERFFCSAAAVAPVGGPREATLEDAEVKRAIARVAASVVLVVDSSKFTRHAPAASVAWESIDLLVTELDADDDRLDAYRDLVEVR